MEKPKSYYLDPPPLPPEDLEPASSVNQNKNEINQMNQMNQMMMHGRGNFSFSQLSLFFFQRCDLTEIFLGPGMMMSGNQGMMQTGPSYPGQGPGGPQMMQGGQPMMGGPTGPQQMGAGYGGGGPGAGYGQRMQPYVQQQMQQGERIY